MIGDMKIAARYCISLLGAVPAVLFGLFADAPWLGVFGLICLLGGALFAAMTTWNRGQVEGMNYMRKLWKR